MDAVFTIISFEHFNKQRGVRWKGRLDQVRQQHITFKARLVIHEFKQTHRIDYEQTSLSVVKFFTLRLMLAFIALENLELHEIDVKTAFLNGVVFESTFMRQPECLLHTKIPNHVRKHWKALYSLKKHLGSDLQELIIFCVNRFRFKAVHMTSTSILCKMITMLCRSHSLSTIYSLQKI